MTDDLCRNNILANARLSPPEEYVTFPTEHPARAIPALVWRSESRDYFASCKEHDYDEDSIALVVRYNGVLHVLDTADLPVIVVDTVGEAMDVISNIYLMRGK